MNDTKWKEIQSAMYGLRESPKWHTRCVANGYIFNGDGEWYHHFPEGGFSDTEWVEVKIENQEQLELALSELKSIHVPDKKTEVDFRMFGYIREGEAVEYL